jgi:hypothetical protein
MARTIDEAFDQLLTRLTPTGTEAAMAASHRSSIEHCLKENFGMARFFRSGSFDHETSVSGYSGVDFFAVIPTSNLNQESDGTLARIASALRTRLPLTNIRVENLAVIVPFGTTRSERHEIIPADYIGKSDGFEVYEIPDRTGGWMRSSPEFYGAYVDGANESLNEKVKPLIRLVKAWRYYDNAPLNSFYIEMRTTEYASKEPSIYYKWDVKGVFSHLITSQLAATADPFNLPNPIQAASNNAEVQAAWTKLQAAYNSSIAALEAEKNGNMQGAFRLWDRVFSGNFPAYY